MAADLLAHAARGIRIRLVPEAIAVAHRQKEGQVDLEIGGNQVVAHTHIDQRHQGRGLDGPMHVVNEEACEDVWNKEPPSAARLSVGIFGFLLGLITEQLFRHPADSAGGGG